jgi:phosphoenolpyruvate carboxykinase (ATP)
VKDAQTEKDIWWGNVNIPITPEAHNLVETAAVAYLNTRERVELTFNKSFRFS